MPSTEVLLKAAQFSNLLSAHREEKYVVVVSCGWGEDNDVEVALRRAISNGAHFKDEGNWATISKAVRAGVEGSVGFDGFKPNDPDEAKEMGRIEWKKTECPEPTCDDGYYEPSFENEEVDGLIDCHVCDGRGYHIKVTS